MGFLICWSIKYIYRKQKIAEATFYTLFYWNAAKFIITSKNKLQEEEEEEVEEEEDVQTLKYLGSDIYRYTPERRDSGTFLIDR